MNYREYQFWGCFGLFLLMINAKKINSWLGGSGWLYHDIKTLDLIETKKNAVSSGLDTRNDFFKLWIDDLICHNLTYGLLNFLSLTHCEALILATLSKVRAVKFFYLTFFYTRLCSLSSWGGGGRCGFWVRLLQTPKA